MRSPFLFPGLASGMMGLDAVQLRDEAGNPVLPAAQLQGMLREALTDLAEASPGVARASDIQELFGEGSLKNSAGVEFDRPNRGNGLLGDLVAEGYPPSGLETTRVEIDDAMGAAKTGHLQVIELVAPFGTEVAFHGSAILFWDDGDAARVVRSIDRALKLIPAIGAFKSAGFGEVIAEACSAEIVERRLLALPAVARSAAGRIGLAATFDRPILVDAQRVVDNAFVGAAIVPGAVFKGALARKLSLAIGEPNMAPWTSALSGLRISHAFPEDAPIGPKAGRPSGAPLPLSMIAGVSGDGGICFADGLVLPASETGDEIAALRGPMIAGRAALFIPDWKSAWKDPAAKHLGWPAFDPPGLLPRTHTKIGPGSVAQEHQLYSTVARSVTWAGEPNRRRRFLLSVDLADMAPGDQSRARQLVELLREGLDGIGKTGASVRFEAWPDGDQVPEARPVDGQTDFFAVVLETDAVLTDPRTEGSAAEAYRAYWHSVLPAARLVDFCAAQSLAGGYLATRRRPWVATYHPFVITQAGSVFLLAGAIQEALRTFIRAGLRLPRFRGHQPGETVQLDWRNCPFVPENGYGAIRADHLSDPVMLARSAVVTYA